MNWRSKINKVESILESWRKRDLSLFDRIQILKTFALSQFVLPATLLVVPPDKIKQIESILYTFLWRGKDRVKRAKVIKELKHDGLNMIDIKSIFMSFKVAWITRFLDSDPKVHGWAEIAHYYLKPFLNCNDALVFNFDDKIDFPDLNHLSSFYRDVFISFNKAFVKDKDTFVDGIQNECLWANRFFVKRERGGKHGIISEKLDQKWSKQD